MSKTLHWFKSSYSDSSGGNCVEVAFDPRAGTSVHLRDSKVPEGPTFAVTPATWSAFLAWRG
ncbi:DUF397 domain-containing protein [Streptomyces sp. NPDC046712]|uniref:DUF397 domain-containing protein n=1 Tax=Streptomyces sp. NPDC046712 TaxID=3154802 RepID=UPI00340F2CD0